MKKNKVKIRSYMFFGNMPTPVLQQWIDDNTKLLETDTENAEMIQQNLNLAKLMLEDKMKKEQVKAAEKEEQQREKEERRKAKEEQQKEKDEQQRAREEEVNAKQEKAQAKQQEIENRKKLNSLYDTTEEGFIKKTVNNVITFFDHTPKYIGQIRCNEFTHLNEYKGKPINDPTFSKMIADVEFNTDINTDRLVDHAIKCVGSTNGYHPIKEKIEELEWDGVERAESFFIDYIGVEDTPLNRIMTKKWFYAMFKRLYEPACNFDNMIIIYDQTQGTGKTKIMQRLLDSIGIGDTYCTSPLNMNNPTDMVAQLNRSWVVGIDELDGFIKASSERAKQILSQNNDTARLSYGHFAETYPRHCIFYGNTNLEYFLKDYSGEVERRYWVMDAYGTPHTSKWWEENLPYEKCKLILAEIRDFYKNNPNYPYADLDPEEKIQLSIVQARHKTSNNDDVLNEELHRTLNRVYPQTIFKNMAEFCRFATNTDEYTYTDTQGNVITCFDDALQKSCNELNLFEPNDKSKDATLMREHILDRIPIAYLKGYIQQVFPRRDSISPQYIKALISDEWTKKVAKYNGKSTNCFVRK